MSVIHVAHVVHSFGVGGLENGIVNLINNLNHDSVRFSICAFTPECESLTRVRERHVSFHVVHKRAGNDWHVPLRLAKIFRAEKPDIVHTHGWATYLEGLLACRMARA